MGRTGETLTLKTVDVGNVTVMLTDDTKVQQPRGVGIRKKDMSAAVLIPGLGFGKGNNKRIQSRRGGQDYVFGG